MIAAARLALIAAQPQDERVRAAISTKLCPDRHL
jgi:hypothetical protein